MIKPRWCFPSNNHGSEHGLDTSDMETFKRDPMSSLAREICQNSIDAKDKDKDGPVRVEFTTFDIPRTSVPGIDDLTSEVVKCYEFNKHSKKEGPALGALVDNVTRPVLTCMRISDFNTTGALGVESMKRNTPFYNLTKGSAVSDKLESSGGSKGIGKFASYVVSDTNTVFYSTLTKEGEAGHLGISKLRSAPCDDNDPDLLTTGEGFFACGKKNQSIKGELRLDPAFARRPGEFGTDVFLVGFTESEGWREEMVAMVLDGFMVAIMRGKLEVDVCGVEIKADTVGKILEEMDLGRYVRKDMIKDIRAQHELLTDDDVIVGTLDMGVRDDASQVTIYMKEYSQKDLGDATRRCIMVRYPYMKIKHITTGAILPFSAMCVIEEGATNDDLRMIENPQHTDWEIKRLKDFPDKEVRKAVKSSHATLKKQAIAFIIERLREGSGESTDVAGAGEYLPSQDETGFSDAEAQAEGEGFELGQIVASKLRAPSSSKKGDIAEAQVADSVDDVSDGDDAKALSEGAGSSGRGEATASSLDVGASEEKGAIPARRLVPVGRMRCRNFAIDKANGIYVCVFAAPSSEENCEMKVMACGDGDDRFPVSINAAFVNGEPCEVSEGAIKGMSIEENRTYTVEYEVDSKELFAGEVVVYASR